jgi:hypothetical protein
MEGEFKNPGFGSLSATYSTGMKYGCILLQKTYVSDCVTGRQSVKRGQFPQYLIESHHGAIISAINHSQRDQR